ncbi:hypothetical protein FHS29_001684 [Saccharothrix tamanrassetensis]|uniref:Uncharacterized protein n=1 Tax=Saccharothrix tamanrassetensis TaxID=1051531 RepID=A0A841CFH0_9PSEU|nr:hypothetical protein [Saccharothrix tamanrassetensis]
MNAESIQGWLLAVGVPAEVVSVGAEADNAWCLVADGEGFEVFWREQGNRYDWARFSSEDVACHYLFGRLVWAQVVRGAVGLLPRPAADEFDRPAADGQPAETGQPAMTAVSAPTVSAPATTVSAPTATAPTATAPTANTVSTTDTGPTGRPGTASEA